MLMRLRLYLEAVVKIIINKHKTNFEIVCDSKLVLNSSLCIGGCDPLYAISFGKNSLRCYCCLCWYVAAYLSLSLLLSSF